MLYQRVAKLAYAVGMVSIQRDINSVYVERLFTLLCLQASDKSSRIFALALGLCVKTENKQEAQTLVNSLDTEELNAHGLALVCAAAVVLGLTLPPISLAKSTRASWGIEERELFLEHGITDMALSRFLGTSKADIPRVKVAMPTYTFSSSKV